MRKIFACKYVVFFVDFEKELGEFLNGIGNFILIVWRKF